MARLTGTGEARVALRKYSFKWGNPVSSGGERG